MKTKRVLAAVLSLVLIGQITPVFAEDSKDFSAEPDIPDYTEIILGDINTDGKVDLTDLTELSLAIIGDKTFTESQIKAADIDENGKADLPDLARLRQYLSKVITSLKNDDSTANPYNSTPLLMIKDSKNNSCYVITEDGNRYIVSESETSLDKELYIQNDKILQKLLYISKNATANHEKYDECEMGTFTYDGGEDYSTSLYAVYYDETGTMKQLNICNIEKNLTECVDWTDVQELVRMLIEDGYIEGKDYLKSLDKKDVAEPDDDISPFELAEKDLESYVQKYKYESAELDIDNDGIVEQCLITYGPTSGLRTHIISAYADGKLKYRNTFNIETHKMSFTEIDGKPCVKMDNDAECRKIYTEGNKIVIENMDPEYEWYWGEAGYNQNME